MKPLAAVCASPGGGKWAASSRRVGPAHHLPFGELDVAWAATAPLSDTVGR